MSRVLDLPGLATVLDARQGQLWRQPRVDHLEYTGGIAALLFSLELVIEPERLEGMVAAVAKGGGSTEGWLGELPGVLRTFLGAEPDCKRLALVFHPEVRRELAATLRVGRPERLGRVEGEAAPTDGGLARGLDAVARELASRRALLELGTAATAPPSRAPGKLGTVPSLWVLGRSFIEDRLDLGVFQQAAASAGGGDARVARTELCRWLGLDGKELRGVGELCAAWDELGETLRRVVQGVGERYPGRTTHVRWFQLLGGLRLPEEGKVPRVLSHLLTAMMAPPGVGGVAGGRGSALGRVDAGLQLRAELGLPVTTWAALLERVVMGGPVFQPDLPEVSGGAARDAAWVPSGRGRRQRMWLPARLVAASARLAYAGAPVSGGALVGAIAAEVWVRRVTAELGAFLRPERGSPKGQEARPPQELRPGLHLDRRQRPPRLVEPESTEVLPATGRGWPLVIVRRLAGHEVDRDVAQVPLAQWLCALLFSLARDQVANAVEQNLPSVRHYPAFAAELKTVAPALTESRLHAGGRRLSLFVLFLRTTTPWVIPVGTWSPLDGVEARPGAEGEWAALAGALGAFHRSCHPTCAMAAELGLAGLQALAEELASGWSDEGAEGRSGRVASLWTAAVAHELGTGTAQADRHQAPWSLPRLQALHWKDLLVHHAALPAVKPDELVAQLFAPLAAGDGALGLTRAQLRSLVDLPPVLLAPAEVAAFLGGLAADRKARSCPWPAGLNPNQGRKPAERFWTVRRRERQVRYPPPELAPQASKSVDKL